MLAGNHEPLKLADGRLVYPDGNVVDPSKPQFVEVPTHREAQRIVVNARRKLSDLPEVPRTMNAINVVLTYSLFGLDTTEIAVATGLSEQQIERIRLTDAYETMHKTLVDSILAAETDNVRDIFRQYSRDAASVMVDALHNGSKGERLLVAKDFLDRAGHRPADIIEHRHKMEGGLTIEIVRKDTHEAPAIDMELPSDN